MNGIVLTIAALLAVAAAAPGHAGYGLGYGFIAAGHGHGHGHYSQPGVAKVQAAQSPLSYEYGLSEAGPHYHKEIRQGGNFAHTVAVPVAAAVPVAHAAIPVAHGYAGHGAIGYGHGLALGHGAVGYGHGVGLGHGLGLGHGVALGHGVGLGHGAVY